jgi:hypothetical protein
MNQQLPLEAITQAPKLSPKTRILLGKVDQKAKSIKRDGIDINDLEKLKTRLTFAWGKEPQAQADAEDAEDAEGVEVAKVAEASAIAVKRWRDRSVRRAYSNVQDRNCHLFLPFVLAVNPTDCSASHFKEALWFFLHEQKYTSYRLRLGPGDKESLESIAITCCFVDSSGYLAFMNSLFPPGAHSLTSLYLCLC